MSFLIPGSKYECKPVELSSDDNMYLIMKQTINSIMNEYKSVKEFSFKVFEIKTVFIPDHTTYDSPQMNEGIYFTIEINVIISEKEYIMDQITGLADITAIQGRILLQTKINIEWVE
jgi:hypothetical protein